MLYVARDWDGPNKVPSKSLEGFDESTSSLPHGSTGLWPLLAPRKTKSFLELVISSWRIAWAKWRTCTQEIKSLHRAGPSISEALGKICLGHTTYGTWFHCVIFDALISSYLAPCEIKTVGLSSIKIYAIWLLQVLKCNCGNDISMRLIIQDRLIHMVSGVWWNVLCFVSCANYALRTNSKHVFSMVCSNCEKGVHTVRFPSSIKWYSMLIPCIITAKKTVSSIYSVFRFFYHFTFDWWIQHL